jgi:predicted  nucleic acid-binding Zn-ribbon protein
MRNGDGEIFPSKACHKIAEQAKRIAALEALLERARPMIDSLKEALHALEIPRENAEMKRVDVSLAIAHIKTALRQLEVAKKAEKAGEGKP